MNVYLNFNGNCEEALKSYEVVFNTVNNGIMRFGDAPKNDYFKEIDPQKIMHTQLTINGSQLMMCDNPNHDTDFGNHISLIFSDANDEKVKEVWESFKLEGAKVEMELGPTFFSPLYGQLIDRFGISWIIMVNLHQPETTK